jgi:hypothetical protein
LDRRAEEHGKGGQNNMGKEDNIVLDRKATEY